MESAQHGARRRTSDLFADIFCAKLRPKKVYLMENEHKNFALNYIPVQNW